MSGFRWQQDRGWLLEANWRTWELAIQMRNVLPPEWQLTLCTCGVCGWYIFCSGLTEQPLGRSLHRHHCQDSQDHISPTRIQLAMLVH
jgi:hypothetical protein